MATAYLTRWSGAVAETSDPYVGSSTTSPTGLPVQQHAQEILVIPGRSGYLDNDNIKNALQTTGALYTTMYYSDYILQCYQRGVLLQRNIRFQPRSYHRRVGRYLQQDEFSDTSSRRWCVYRQEQLGHIMGEQRVFLRLLL